MDNDNCLPCLQTPFVLWLLQGISTSNTFAWQAWQLSTRNSAASKKRKTHAKHTQHLDTDTHPHLDTGGHTAARACGLVRQSLRMRNIDELAQLLLRLECVAWITTSRPAINNYGVPNAAVGTTSAIIACSLLSLPKDAGHVRWAVSAARRENFRECL